MAVYGVLGLLAFLENLLPPLPADLAVALGAFLSQRGVTRPVTVFLVVWPANVAGAAVVYGLSRQWGRRFLRSRAGRRLVSPAALRFIEREYLRFGAVGLWLVRLLPAVRAAAAPFAGLANFGPLQALVPIALASGVWHALIIWVGATVGANWEQIRGLVATINGTLAAVAVVALAVAGALVYTRLRRRARTRAAADLAALSAALATDAQGQADLDPRALTLALLELLYRDSALGEVERGEIERHLADRWGLARATGPAPPPATGVRALLDRLGRERRIAMVERMWEAAFADGSLSRYESLFVERAAALLGVDEAALAEVRLRLVRREAP